MKNVKVLIYIDKDNGLPHCWNRHMVTADEVREVFATGTHRYNDDRTDKCNGVTRAGRAIEIIYKRSTPDTEGHCHVN